jgi:alpha-galactosidase
MAFRAWVAAQRSLGYELDLRELTDEEAATLGSVTRWWKANREWMMSADILRLEVADPAVTAELQLAADGERFVVFAGQNAASSQVLPCPLRLAGLDPVTRYRIELLNSDASPPQSRGPVALRSDSLILTGRRLMSAGISLPIAWPGTMWVIQGEKVVSD